MEQQLKCAPLLRLKEMALRTVVALSWSGSDVLASASNVEVSWLIHLYSSGNEWQERVEYNVRNKVSELGLPKSLEKQALDLVPVIGFEIKKWKVRHDELRKFSYGYNGLLRSAKLCWTSLGTIDDLETAKSLVHSDAIDVDIRYEIACLYCLEDSIPLLWRELSEEMKVYYSRKKKLFQQLAFVWPHILSGELSSMKFLLRKENGRILTSFNQWGFEYSVEHGYKTAAKYFFQKLTYAEREDSIMRSANASLSYRGFRKKDKTSVDFACYLLTLLTPREQMEIVKKYPINFLLIFLQWPLQDLFVENARLLWTYVPEEHYAYLLCVVRDRFRELCFLFPKLFKEFFIQSPLEFKKDIIAKESKYFSAGEFLSLFIRSENVECIELIFRNLEEETRVNILFHRNVVSLFHESILEKRWDMVKVCLLEAGLSSKDKEIWKEGFMELFPGRLIQREDPKWKGFFEFFNENDVQERGQKRKLAELLDD